MLRTGLFVCLALSACAPAKPTAVYVGAAQPTAAPPGRGRRVALRGRVPRGTRVDYIVAVQIDRQGKRQRVRVRPAADGSYQLHLPPGHQYAMAYEQRGRIVGNVTFPSGGGRPSQVINLSQNVVVNQQFIDLGEPTYINGTYVAAADPELYLDSDADGLVDAQDPDDVDDEQIIADASYFEGDFEEVDNGGYEDGAYDTGDTNGAYDTGDAAYDDGDRDGDDADDGHDD